MAKGQGIIVLDANGFTKSVDRVNKSFDDLDRRAVKSMQSVEDGAKDAERALDEVGDQAKKTGKDMVSLSLNVIGLGQAIGGVTDGIFAFDEKLVALERSKFGLEQTTVDLRRTEEDLKIAMKEGELTTLEFARAIEDLKLLRKDHAIELKEIAAEEKALQGELANFGLTLAQTGFFGFNTFNEILSVNQKKWIAAKFSMLGFNKASIATAFSMKGLRAAMTLVSKHPLMTVALVAAAALMAEWESGTLGLRDALSGLAGVELPTITGLVENLAGDIFPEANQELTELDKTIMEAEKQLASMTDTVDGTGTAFEYYTETMKGAKDAGDSLTSPAATGNWTKYWDTQRKGAEGFGLSLTHINKEVSKLKSSGFSSADVKRISLGFSTRFTGDFKGANTGGLPTHLRSSDHD